MRNFTKAIIFPALASTSLAAIPAHAENVSGAAETTAADSSSDQISDIVVTARRRAEPLQKTPLAITAVDAVRLQEARATDITGLTNLAPSVQVQRNSANASSVFPFIRGFGSKSSNPASEPAVALSVDGIFLSTVIGSYINLADVEAVEVQRGPQGTLVGKNAPAGVLSLRTRRPKFDFNGQVRFDYGSYGDFQAFGYVDVPIVADKLAWTMSYFHHGSDGYTRNIGTGELQSGLKTQTIRTALLATPNDNITWEISGQDDQDRGETVGSRNISDKNRIIIPTAKYVVTTPKVSTTCTNAFALAYCTSFLPNTAYNTTDAQSLPDSDSWGYNIVSDLNINTGPVNLTSVTGYRKFHEDVTSDIDGTRLSILTIRNHGTYKQFSQEFRLASSDGGGMDMGGKLNWLVGAFYLWFDYSRPVDQVALGGASKNFQHGRNISKAIFANFDYELVDGLHVAGGLRQTWDQKEHDSLAPNGYASLQNAKWKDFSYDGSINYSVTPDAMVYFRYATGYRGGAFAGNPTSALNEALVNPETVKSYEIGAKADFFDHRLRVNIAAYSTKYYDLQRTITQSIAVTPFFITIPSNIAAASTKGLEVEVIAKPVKNFELRGNVAYIDPKYTKFTANLTGNIGDGATDNTSLPFPYISDWTASFGGSYKVDLGGNGSLKLSADYSYRSKYNVTDIGLALGQQKAFSLVNASLKWTAPGDRYSVTAYGRNLTKARYIDGGDQTGFITTFVSDGAPRTFGVSVDAKF